MGGRSSRRSADVEAVGAKKRIQSPVRQVEVHRRAVGPLETVHACKVPLCVLHELTPERRTRQSCVSGCGVAVAPVPAVKFPSISAVVPA